MNKENNLSRLLTKATKTLRANWLSRFPTVGNLYGITKYNSGEEDFAAVDEVELWKHISSVVKDLSSSPSEDEVSWCADKLDGLESSLGTGGLSDKLSEHMSNYHSFVTCREAGVARFQAYLTRLAEQMDTLASPPDDKMKDVKLVLAELMSKFDDYVTEYSSCAETGLVGTTLHWWYNKGALYPATAQAILSFGLDLEDFFVVPADPVEPCNVKAEHKRYKGLYLLLSPRHDHLVFCNPELFPDGICTTETIQCSFSISKAAGVFFTGRNGMGAKHYALSHAETDIICEFFFNVFSPTEEEISIFNMAYPDVKLMKDILEFRQFLHGIINAA